MRTFILLSAQLSLCFLYSSTTSAAPVVGMAELHRLDLLPSFKTSVSLGAVTSYDRTGGNDDGFSGKYSFVRKDPEGVVLADLKGPGVIYRVWTPTPTDDILEFIFDGEATPRVSLKYRDLFLGTHPAFPRPLVGFGAGGYYCYVPMPFEKGCVVRIRAQKTQFYQINYATYGPDANIKTFSPEATAAVQADIDRAREAFSRPGTDLSAQVAPPGSRIAVERAAVQLTPKGTQKIFEAKRGGRIVGLRMGPAEAIAGKARDLVLRISFDGEEPAVACPLGDFFGYAWGQPAMKSLLVGTSGTTNYCYFPMPFDRAAMVEVVSERDSGVDLWAEVAHTTDARRPDEGRFHAAWRRENPTKIGEPYTFIDARGRGHLVGVILQSQGFESGKTLFFEGDDQTTIDGKLVIHGTGSEDFFNGGWYDVPDRWEKRLSFPLSGCLGYAKHLGRTGAYRLFFGDAYAYKQSLLQTIEHAGEKNSIPTDYCSVSFLYTDSKAAASLPPLAERAVQDPREVVFPAFWQLPIYAWSFERASLTRKKEKVGKDDVGYLALAATGSDWFGPHFLSPVVNVPVTGKYSILVNVVKGPDQAKVQLFQNENPIGDPVDLYAPELTRGTRLLLGSLDLAEGNNNLMIKLVGRNEHSSGLGLNLVEIICAQD